MQNNKKYAVIVAGGSGTRMGTDIPKQFLELAGLPVLMHTLLVFYKAFDTIDLILVLPRNQFEFWQELCKKYNFGIPHQLAFGGETRFHSVRNGLDLVEKGGLVGIHDGVRPLVSLETIQRCYSEAEQFGNAIPVTEVVETVRSLEAGKSITLDRGHLRLVQTPQVFKSDIIKDAFNQPYKSGFTDDASVLESFGGEIHLTPGNKENIKITHITDLVVAESLMNLMIKTGNPDHQ